LNDYVYATLSYNNLGEETVRDTEAYDFDTHAYSSIGTFTQSRQADGKVTQTVRTNSGSQNGKKTLTYGTCSACMGQVKEEEDRDGSNNLVKRQVYDYDKNGNRIAHEACDSGNTYAGGEALTYNAANQLGLVTYYGPGHSTTRTQDFSGQVDSNGNLTKALGTDASATSYVESYFPDGKVQAITDGGSHTESSCYGANGLLCTRNGAHYAYDGSDVIAVWTSGDTAEERMHGLLFDAEINSTSNGTFTSSTFGYWHYDPTGNMAMATSYGGSVSSAYTVDFYGTNPSPSTAENNYQAASGTTNRTDPQVDQTVNGGVIDPPSGQGLQDQGGTSTAFSIRFYEYTCYMIIRTPNRAWFFPPSDPRDALPLTIDIFDLKYLKVSPTSVLMDTKGGGSPSKFVGPVLNQRKYVCYLPGKNQRVPIAWISAYYNPLGILGFHGRRIYDSPWGTTDVELGGDPYYGPENKYQP
jgi:hypothetical protein